MIADGENAATEYTIGWEPQPGPQTRIKRIASWILTSGVKMVTARDLTRNVTGMRGLGARAIHARVSPLVAAGWLLPYQPLPEYNTKWAVTPAVARQFEARKRDEERRKAEWRAS